MNSNMERRKHERIRPAVNTFAFLRSSGSESIVAAKLLDISDQGIALEHIGEEIFPYTEVELDIVLPAGEADLLELSGVTVYDRAIKGRRNSDHATRHCGIGFQNLTDFQKTYVRSLLRYFSQNSGS